MIFWFSAELKDDVADACRGPRNFIEKTLNQELSRNEYGDGVKKWAFLPIILDIPAVPQTSTIRNLNPTWCRLEGPIIGFRFCLNTASVVVCTALGGPICKRKLAAPKNLLGVVAHY